MNLDYLRYFVKLAEVRHYTKAAEQLCITQPSLSHAIRLLETELGVPLFEKTGRNTALTRFEDQVIAGLVAQGFGIAVVPYMDLLLKLDVTILEISAPPYKREFFLVHNDNVFLPPAARNFRQFVLDNRTE